MFKIQHITFAEKGFQKLILNHPRNIIAMLISFGFQNVFFLNRFDFYGRKPFACIRVHTGFAINY